MVNVRRTVERSHSVRRAVRRHWRGKTVLASSLGAILVSLLMVTCGTAAAPRSSPISTSGLRAGAVAPSPGSLLSLGDVTTGLASTYSQLARAGIDVSRFSSTQTVANEVYQSFQHLSTDSAFVTSLGSFGSAAFNLGFSFNNQSGVDRAYFEYNWQSATNSSTTYWELNIETGQVSGPVTQSSPLVYNSVMSGLTYSTFWAGYEYWSVSPQYPLGGNQADEVVPTISQPSQKPINVPSGVSIDAWGSVWVGVAGGTYGTSDLLQTGFDTDATHPSNANYNLWYEFFPSPQVNYPNSPVTKPGDNLWESITVQSSGLWYLDVYDKQKGAGSSVLLNEGSWRPYYAEFITEAQSSGQTVQQLPMFTTPVNYYDSMFCSYTFSNCWNAGGSGLDYNVYQNYQAHTYTSGWGDCGWQCAFWNNTNQYFSTGCGGMYGGCGFPGVSWTGSAYDYTVAHWAH